MILKWIEVEPGAPLPAEVPPWSARYELVKRPGLPERFQKAIQASGLALLAGSVATAVLVGGGAGFVDVYAGIAAILGLALLFFGLIGVPPSEKYVPSPGGRYVAVEAVLVPPDPAEAERARTFERRILGLARAGAALIGTILLFEYLRGDFTLRGLLDWLWLLVLAAPYLIEAAVKAGTRRLKSEAEVSQRFLHAADPRVPLAAPGAPAAAVDSTSPSGPE